MENEKQKVWWREAAEYINKKHPEVDRRELLYMCGKYDWDECEWYALREFKAFEDGFKKCFESKFNTTTISDCPLPDGDAEKDTKIRMLSQKVYDLQKQSDQLTEAKEILKQWLQTSKASGCDNINIVTDTEQFISEVEK